MIDKNNVLWLSESDIGLIKEDSYQGEGIAFVRKDSFDALLKDWEEIGKMHKECIAANGRLGVQMRALTETVTKYQQRARDAEKLLKDIK